MKAKKGFTSLMIKSLRPKKKSYVVSDPIRRGFGIRVFPSGRKSFYFRYRFPGKPKRNQISLGGYPAMSLEKAFEIYSAMYLALLKGIDPMQKRVATDDAPTVQQFGEIFIEKHSKPSKKSWRDDARILKNNIYPFIGAMKISDLSKSDIVKIIDPIIGQNKPSMAEAIFKVTRKMLNFGVSRGALPSSPCLGLSFSFKGKVRERVLSDEEIRDLWCSGGLTDDVHSILKLILLTGCRPSEVCGMHRDEISDHVWTIPSNRTKTGQAHTTWLSELSLVPADRPELIFPSLTGESLKARGLSLALRRLKPKFGWVPYDLRRTCATRLSENGVSDEIIDRVLGHGRKNVLRHYIHTTNILGIKEALELWSAIVTRIIE